jgi:pSer/pThr/pTyr-binding forkhead associated (FHA) protein
MPISQQPDSMERMMEDSAKEPSYLVYEMERRAYPLAEGSFTIGRDATSGIVIREPAVSRSHAEVQPDGDEFVLSATGATGTRLNGVPVTAPSKLADGDRIEIGSAEITFRQGRLPLGVSVVDDASPSSFGADAMTRRPTITNPILGGTQAIPEKKKSASQTLILFFVLAAAAAYFLFLR